LEKPTLHDNIFGLKLISNDSVQIKTQCSDVNDDHKIGLEDIYIHLKINFQIEIPDKIIKICLSFVYMFYIIGT